MSRLTGLVGAAETLLQEMGSSAWRMQTLEREAASRKHLLAEQAKQQASLAESLSHAANSLERSQITTELHAKETRANTLRAEETQSRESIAEAIQLFASEREDYLRVVKALKDAIDEADKERGTATDQAKTAMSPAGRSRGERGSDQIGSTELFRNKLREFVKTIRSEKIPIDPDKTIYWIEATLNGKSRKVMMADLGVQEIRLSARMASEVGARPAPGDQAVDIATIDGRTISARPARLETIQVGPFTQREVDCVVLPESAGDVPSVLGSGFFKHFSTTIDTDGGAIALTQVQVKPILHASKAAAARSASSSKTKKAAPSN